MVKQIQEYSLKTVLFFLAMSGSISAFSQGRTTDYNFNTSNLVNDINQELNDHKPHGEYRSYVISGVFKKLSNARAYVNNYRSESGNEVFIFKEEGEMYYVCPEGPLKLDDAKKLAEKLNNQDNTNSLSDGNVWILTK